MSRVVLATFGSFGDLNPLMGIGRELARRGHHPVIVSTAGWQSHVKAAGLEFRRARSGWDPIYDLQAAPGVHIERLVYDVAERGLFTDIEGSYNDLVRAIDDADALVAVPQVVAAPLVARKTGIPWITAVIEPMSFFSTHEPIVLPLGLPLAKLKNISRPVVEPIERLRTALGLPPGGNPLYEEHLSADAVLGLFSPMLGNRQPDWPPEAVITGFVADGQFPSAGAELERLREFLDAGPPPIVFTLSSDAAWAAFSERFNVESVSAAEMVGRRAILVGSRLPEGRTDRVLMLKRVPFSEVFPRAAAIVHHAGIGTTACALKAGKPMLAVPEGMAQPDIAARLVRLGVARAVHRAAYDAAAAARELRALFANPGYAITATAVAQRIASEDGARPACDVIERIVSRHAKPAVHTRGTAAETVQKKIYLHLLKRTLTRYPLEPAEQQMFPALRDLSADRTRAIAEWVFRSRRGASGHPGFNPVLRAFGMDWPSNAETMIGLTRLDNLEHCMVNVLQRNVPGDFAETGVWRGGASILMRAILAVYGDTERKVWVADSFQGLPMPDSERYPADQLPAIFPQLAVPMERVKANFARYGLLDAQVCFLPGWFRDTLPTAPIDRLAVLRLDGDLYESTIVALSTLYHKVSPGGFVIVDDYSSIGPCRQAVDDFRAEHGIAEPLCPIDWTGVYWQVLAHPATRDSTPRATA